MKIKAQAKKPRVILPESFDRPPSAAPPLKLLTRKQFADALGVCAETVRRMERKGMVRSIRISRNILRFHPNEIDRLAGLN